MATTIELCDSEVSISPPKSYAVRYDIAAAGGGMNPHRAFAAALGVSWVDAKTRPGGVYGAPFDVATYGGGVIDALMQRGASMETILAAGVVAYNEIGATLFKSEEVEAATQGFRLP